MEGRLLSSPRICSTPLSVHSIIIPIHKEDGPKKATHSHPQKTEQATRPNDVDANFIIQIVQSCGIDSYAGGISLGGAGSSTGALPAS